MTDRNIYYGIDEGIPGGDETKVITARYITGNKPHFVIIDEFSDIPEDLFMTDWGDIESRVLSDPRYDHVHYDLRVRPPMPKLPFIDVEDIRFRDPKQPAWANGNQAPRNVRKRR